MLESDVDFYGLKDWFGTKAQGQQRIRWSYYNAYDGIDFSDNNQTAVIHAGVQFPDDTRIFSQPLKNMMYFPSI